VVHPADAKGNFLRFKSDTATSFESTWKRDRIEFRAGSKVWDHPGSMRPLDQTLHLNLWGYAEPKVESEVILDRFEFLPLR
jgi:hypothetical protein